MTSPNVREIKRGSAHTRVLPPVARTNTQNEHARYDYAREASKGFMPLPHGRKRAIEPAE